MWCVISGDNNDGGECPGSKTIMKKEQAKKPVNDSKAIKIAVVAAICAVVIIVGVLIVLSMTAWKPKSNGGDSGSTEIAKDEPKNKKNDGGSNKKSGDANIAGIISPSIENGNIGDHVRGNESSDVVLVEYADLQCPGCASMMTVIDGVYEDYRDEVAFVFRNYPLSSHQLAVPAAKAVEAAGKQGYYWDALSYLFGARKEWVGSDDEMKAASLLEERYAGKTDFNVIRFRADYASEEIAKKIEYDKEIGADYAKVNATPSLYLNGEKIDFSSAKNFAQVREIIIEALDKKVK